MKDKITEYTAEHRMRDLIDDNNHILMVAIRFGINIGFGYRTVAEYCAENNIDCATFLAIANLISFNKTAKKRISLPQLTRYLRCMHSEIIDFILPNMRQKLLDIINVNGSSEITSQILALWDECAMLIINHIKYENESILDYWEKINYDDEVLLFPSMKECSESQSGIVEYFNKLKYMVIRYYTRPGDSILNQFYYDVVNFENDCLLHGEIENRLFFPEVEHLEKELGSRRKIVKEKIEETVPDNKNTDLLSNREKDIIRCVARGLSNKETATELSLSVHTVLTHRRNISSKLQIHSAAGLTIYAIVHDLIYID